MNQSFPALVVLAAVAMGGCVGVQGSRGGTEWYVMAQVGVTVRVVNNCAPYLDLERVGGVVVKGLAYGDSATIPMASTPFSGSNRQMPLTAKGYRIAPGSTARVYLGSVTRDFSVSTYEGSREEVWEVDQLRLPGGRGGCQ